MAYKSKRNFSVPAGIAGKGSERIQKRRDFARGKVYNLTADELKSIGHWFEWVEPEELPKIEKPKRSRKKTEKKPDVRTR